MKTTLDTSDLLVIGGGSAGIRAARVAAQLGAKVVLADPKPLGGTCVNRGCVPKKLLWYAGGFKDAIGEAREYGWNIDSATLAWPKLIKRTHDLVHRLNHYYDGLLRDAGVAHVIATARFLDAHTVAVAERQIRPRYILIATGARPVLPSFRGAELGITSDDVFDLPDLPTRMVIVGGGYIGVEFAGILHRLGCKTTLAHKNSSLLQGFDAEAVAFLTSELRRQGLEFCLGRQITTARRVNGCIVTTLDDGSTLTADMLLNAVGRQPHYGGLDLEAAGLAVTSEGAIRVDADYRTNQSHIFAIGDVTDRLQLTPVALAEGSYVAQHLFGNSAVPVDYDLVPTGVFSYPNVSAVGLTEQQACDRGVPCDVYVKDFRPLQHSFSPAPQRAFMKLVVEQRSRRLLGAHMVGDGAPEIIQGIAAAMQAGITKDRLDNTIGIHPTTAEEFVSMRESRPARQ